MARKTGRDRRPYVKRVERIELPEGISRVRVILMVAALLIGVGAIVYGLVSAVTTDSGWQRIQSNTNDGQTCAGEFVFNAQLGRSGVAASVEARQLTTLYTELTDKAYRVFDEQQQHLGYANVFYINANVNREIEVDPWLYRAFEQLARSGSRALFLAPVYDEWRNVFAAESDAEAVNYDPYLNAEKASELREICTYVNDPAQVDLVLLGDNRVRLAVSEEYRQYAAENGIDRFIDFFLMKNAFIADILADAIIEAGYPVGSLTSYDGFTRNFDVSGEEYGYTLLDQQEGKVYDMGQMLYHEPRAIVMLRSYALGTLDALHYYHAGDGVMRVPYIRTDDGLCHSAVPNLVGYSATEGCAAILLKLLPVYTAEQLDDSALEAFAQEGLHSIRFQAGEICATDPALIVSNSGGSAQ